MDLMQVAPGFDETQRWIANNGLAAVFLVLFFSLFAWVIRWTLSNLVKQIAAAVTYFTTKLDTISERQEKSLDRLDDRMGQMSKTNAEAASQLANVLQRQGELLASMNESIRIQLNFTTQQMAQQAMLTQQVKAVAEHTAAPDPSTSPSKEAPRT